MIFKNGKSKFYSVDEYLFMLPALRHEVDPKAVLNIPGFIRMELPGCSSYLLVKNNVLN